MKKEKGRKQNSYALFLLVCVCILGMFFGSLFTDTARAFLFGSETLTDQWLKGDNNTIQLQDETSNVRIGSNGLLYADIGNGFVGIGTTNPQAKLDVATGNGSSGIKTSLICSNGTSSKLYTNADGLIVCGVDQAGNGSGNLVDTLAETLAAGNNANTTGIINLGNIAIANSNPGALLDIGLAGTTLGTMRLAGSASGYVQIQPGTAAGSWTLTLPASGGTSGYFLQTNGSGTTSWATAVTTEADPIVKAISGIVKSNGSAISAAISGTDYSAGTAGLATGILKSTTGTGALAIAVANDFPTLNQSTTGNAATATALSANGTNCSAGSAPLGIDASGNVENCFNVITAETDPAYTAWNKSSGISISSSQVSDFATSVSANADVIHGTTAYGWGNWAHTTLAGYGITDALGLHGTADAATKLATSRNINGTAFDGSADITVTADANTLSGTTLHSTILNSSLTSVGTLANLTVTNPISGSVTGNAGTVTNGTYTNSANSFSLINPLTTLAESWIGPGDTAGIYFKGGNVGMGTTNPGYKLEVNGAVNATSVLINGSAISGSRWTANGNNIYYNSGNVGIGTTAPAGKLHVAGGVSDGLNESLRIGGGSASYNSGGAISFQNRHGDDAYPTWLTGQIGSVYGPTNNWNGALVFLTNTGTSETNLTEKMRITSAGNVGIGTTAPATKFEVYGTDVSGSSIRATRYDGASRSIDIIAPATSDVGKISMVGTDSPLTFWTGSSSTEKLRIGPTGNVGIGTTNPATKLDVYGANPYLGGVATGRFVEIGTTGDGYAMIQGRGNRDVAINNQNLTLQPNDGNVGIGITNPANYRLVIGGTGLGSGFSAGISLNGGQSGGDYDGIGYNFRNTASSGIYNYNVADTSSRLEFLSGGFRFKTAPVGTVGAVITYANAMTISQSGNVAIGKDTPSYKLDVNGAINATSVLVNGVAVGAGGTQWASGAGGVISYTGGNVGIGTASPADKLDIAGHLTLSGGSKEIRFRNAAGATEQYVWHSGTSLGLGPGSLATSTYITSAGNVGIGTTGPIGRLEINNPGTELRLTGRSGGVPSGLFSSASADRLYLTDWATATKGIVIDLSNGYVGIGTTAPSKLLELAKSSNSGSSNSYPSLRVINSLATIGDGASTWNIADLMSQAGNGTVDTRLQSFYDSVFAGGKIGTVSNHPLAIQTYSIERLRIDTSGNVGIGTTAPGVAKLNIQGLVWADHAATDTFLDDTVGDFQGTDGYWRFRTGANFRLALDTYNSAWQESMSVLRNGNVGIGTTNPGEKLTVINDSQYNAGTGLKIRSSATGNNNMIWLGASSVDDASTIQSYKENVGVKSLLLNPNGGSVGIGTTNPAYKLDINGAVNATSVLVNGVAVGAGGTQWASGTGGVISYSGGNVGIGTTSPVQLLDIYTNTNTENGLAIQNVNAGATAGARVLLRNNVGYSDIVYLSSGYSSGDYGTAAANDLLLINRTGNIKFRTNGFNGDSLTRMTIDTAGNVGIGTTVPGRKLDVTDSSNGYTGINVINASSGTAARAALVSSNGSAYAAFGMMGTNNSTVSNIGFIDSGNGLYINGNVGIGSSPLGKLSIYDSRTGWAYANAVLKADGGTNQQSYIAMTPSSAGGTFPNSAFMFWDSMANSPIVFGTAAAYDGGWNERMRITASGNVGIGTINPSYKLDVAGAINATSVLVNGVAVGAGGTQWASGGSGVISYTGGSVGIGTASPFTNLSVNGTGTSHSDTFKSIITLNQDYTNYRGLYLGYNPNEQTGILAAAGISGNLAFYTFNSVWSEKMRITAAGNVGIGTTNPLHRFDISGSGVQEAGITSTDNYSGLVLSGGQTGDVSWRMMSGYPNAGDFTIRETGVGNYVIVKKTTGNVGIGTTNPGGKLEVDSAYDQIRIVGNSDANVYDGAIINFQNDNNKRFDLQLGSSSSNTRVGANNFGIYDTTNSAARFVVNQSGNVGIGTTSPDELLTVYNNGGTPRTLVYDGTTKSVLQAAGGIGWTGTLTNHPFEIGTNGNTGMALSISGNIGIGTTNPVNRLHVEGANGGSAGIYLNSAAPSSATYTLYNDSGTLKWNGIALATGSSVSGVTGYIPKYTDSNSLGDSNIFESNRNIGIGTTNPLYDLDVAGTFNVSDTSTFTGSVGIGATAPTSILHTIASGAKTDNYSGNLLTNIATSSTAAKIKSGLEIASTGIWNGTLASNIGLYVSSVTGGTSNYDAIFNGGGNVGIGTVAPGNLLTLNSANTFAMEFDLSGAAKTLVGLSANANDLTPGTVAGDFVIRSQGKNILFSTDSGSTTQMYLKNGGNVGIGTTAPDRILHIAGSGNTDVAEFENTSATGYATFLFKNNLGHTAFTGLGGGSAGSWTDEMVSGTASDIPLVLATNNLERIRISNDGKVGIGVTNPVATLEVAGNIRTTGEIYSTTNNVGGNDVTLGSWAGHRGMWTDYDIEFMRWDGSVGIRTDMIIDSTGKVGIGTTSPMAKFDIPGLGGLAVASGINLDPSNNFNLVPLQNSGRLLLGWNRSAGGGETDLISNMSGGSPGGFNFYEYSNTGTLTHLVTFRGNGNVGIGNSAPSYQFQLSTDSAGKPNGGSWANSSDQRLKTNIETMSSALDRLTRLRGVNFNWINQDEHPYEQGIQGGFIAQEVESVFPNWVKEVDGTGKDGALTGGKTKTLTLPFEFDALVVESIKEQQKQIDNLKLRLNGLGLVNATSTDNLAQSDVANPLQWLTNGLQSMGLALENGIASLKEVIAGKFTGDEANIKKVQTEQMTAQQMCVAGTDGETVCLSKDQLKDLISKAGSSVTISKTYDTADDNTAALKISGSSPSTNATSSESDEK